MSDKHSSNKSPRKKTLSPEETNQFYRDLALGLALLDTVGQTISFTVDDPKKLAGIEVHYDSLPNKFIAVSLRTPTLKQ